MHVKIFFIQYFLIIQSAIMKTKSYLIIVMLVVVVTTATAQSANTTLSNLKSPTAVNQNLLPGTAHSKNLGNSSNQWQYLYLYGRIYLNGVLTMHAHGTENFFAGPYAGNTSVTGIGNTGTGENALYKLTQGDDNTANGFNALYYDTSGYYNTGAGAYALYNNFNGIENSAVGVNALLNNATGSYNTAVGASSLIFETGGSFNTAVGFGAYNAVNDYQNSSAFGYSTVITADNEVRIGNSSVTSIGGYADWTNISDARVKKNIKQDVPGLAFINKLVPITYNLDLDAADRIIQKAPLKDKNGNIIQPSSSELNARAAKEKTVYSGFIAQDVEKAAKELNYDFSGIDAAKNDKDLYGLRYAQFVVPLVKAVQELSKQNDSLQSKVNELENLKTENAALETRVAKLEAMMNMQQSVTNNYKQPLNISSGTLDQNIPNPFSNTTTISYTLPQQFLSAKIIVSDKNGVAMKQIDLSNNKGSVSIDASTLAAGTYQYTLYADGKLIDTKKMVLSR
jgi:hypothetical protein